MRALVVKQPWATLIALGVKTIETRPGPPNGPMRPAGVRGLPGCALVRGERIAIVAGAAVPRVGLVGGGPLIVKHLNSNPSQPLMVGGYREGPWLRQVGPPFVGAVVCTVAVSETAECVGLDPNDCGNFVIESEGEPYITEGSDGRWYWIRGRVETADVIELDGTEITDQYPLGDFTPGRWGWLLTDPTPCDPIPCKGRQGVFELPDDVNERLAALREQVQR